MLYKFFLFVVNKFFDLDAVSLTETKDATENPPSSSALRPTHYTRNCLPPLTTNPDINPPFPFHGKRSENQTKKERLRDPSILV